MQILPSIDARLPWNFAHCLPDSHAAARRFTRAFDRGRDLVGVFMHKPLCCERLDRADPPGWSMELPARERLWSVIATGAVRFVASGHLHRSRSGLLPRGIATVWAPSTAFIAPERSDGALRRCGVIEFVLDGPNVRWSHVEPDGLEHSLSDAFKAGAVTLRNAPPRPYQPLRQT